MNTGKSSLLVNMQVSFIPSFVEFGPTSFRRFESLLTPFFALDFTVFAFPLRSFRTE